MGRRGSSHGNPMHTLHGAMKGFNDLIQAADVLTGDPPAQASEAQVQDVISSVSRLRPTLKMINDLAAALDAVVDLDLEIEPRRQAAEHELQEITDAVREKASRAAELSEEIKRLSATVDAKLGEAAELNRRIAEYKSFIAAL